MSSPPPIDAELILATIVASSRDALFSENAAGVITSWNQSAERIFGFTESEVVGHTSDLIVPVDRRDQANQVLHRIRASQGVEHFETDRLRKDGSRARVSATVAALVSSRGDTVGTVTIARDITQHIQLERDARHFDALADAADDAIISKDLSGVIVSWNRAAERLFGYTAAEAIGRSIRLLVPADCQAEEDQILSTVGRGDVIDKFETVRLRQDGSRVPISLTVSPIRALTGEIIGASTIARDLSLSRTQRVQADAMRLAAIVDSSDDAIVSKDLNGIVTSWNASAEAMFGFSSAEMVGRSIRLLIPDDRQQEEDVVLFRIRRGERVEHYETLRKRKDGSFIPVSLTVSPIRSRDGTVIGASKIARDISERQRAEEERQRLLGIARDAARLKDEFLATLSHELRTPLNAIIGYLRMIQAGMLVGDKQARAVDIVVRNAASLNQIVEDVLDVSRIISGKLRLEVQSVELPLIIDQALENVRPAADAKGVRLDALIDPDAPAVSGDPERLRQILWNLCSNAVKFTDRGGRVQARLERVNSHLAITISDTGIGIAAEFLPHVFERFRQADAGMNRLSGGLGLGLAISRHLVELQGGRIFAHSDGAGKGSTFRVELPIRSVGRAGPAEPQRHPQTPAVLGPMIVPDLTGVRILAVDDNRDSLALVREVLEGTGANVVTADSGEEALEKLQRMRPDVIMADLGMPHMDGFELIARIRSSDDIELAEVPAAALTAFARSEDRARALRSGFQLHLAKPIEPGELMAAIAALVKRRPNNE